MCTVWVTFSLTNDSMFITLNAFSSGIPSLLCRGIMMRDVSKESAQEIAIDFVRKKKNSPKIDVSTIEQHSQDWIVRGTCPIDLEGHPWAEKFEVIVDPKGKIKYTYFQLL